MAAQFIVVAGPNGAGKTTFVTQSHFAVPILDPDRIARGLNMTGIGRQVEAGRLLHEKIESCFLSGVSFGLETTLSGQTVLKTMRRAKSLGMSVALHYVGLNSLNLSKLRVHQRVIKGGHGIPDDQLERRFDRTLANLAKALLIADRTMLYDNSTENRFRCVGKLSGGRWSDLDPSVDWLSRVAGAHDA
jgi:predicted ABC-type ATPase